MAFQNGQETYQKLNDAISMQLFQQKLNVRIYQTAQLAAFDVALGLQQYLAHKPQIGLCKNGSNLIESLCSQWLRTHTPVQLKTENQHWYEFVENLSPETSFVLWTAENEITGEITIPDKQVLEIHQQLAQKRIFSIQIVHEEKFNLENLLPYSILISKNHLFSTNSSIVIHGEKVKTPTLMGHFQDLNQEMNHELNKNNPLQFNFISSKHETDLGAIENQFVSKNLLYFNQFATLPYRLTDRLVLYFPDMAGAAIQQYLKLPAEQCLSVSQVPFWSIDLWKKWWKEAESEKLIRGLLRISIKAFAADSLLVKKIEKAIVEIKQQSSWTVA